MNTIFCINYYNANANETCKKSMQNSPQKKESKHSITEWQQETTDKKKKLKQSTALTKNSNTRSGKKTTATNINIICVYIQ